MIARKKGKVIHGGLIQADEDAKMEFRRQARLEMLESKTRKAPGKQQQSPAGAGKLSKGELARLRKKQKKEKNKSKKNKTAVASEEPKDDEGETLAVEQ